MSFIQRADNGPASAAHNRIRERSSWLSYDPSFKNRWPAAWAAGLLGSADHVFVEATSPHKQADNILQVLGDDPGDLPLTPAEKAALKEKWPIL